MFLILHIHFLKTTQQSELAPQLQYPQHTPQIVKSIRTVVNGAVSTTTPEQSANVKKELMQKVLANNKQKQQQQQQFQEQLNQEEGELEEEVVDQNNGSFVVTPDYIQQSR